MQKIMVNTEQLLGRKYETLKSYFAVILQKIAIDNEIESYMSK